MHKNGYMQIKALAYCFTGAICWEEVQANHATVPFPNTEHSLRWVSFSHAPAPSLSLPFSVQRCCFTHETNGLAVGLEYFGQGSDLWCRQVVCKPFGRQTASAIIHLLSRYWSKAKFWHCLGHLRKTSFGGSRENHRELSMWKFCLFRVSPDSVCFLIMRTPQPWFQGQFPAVSSSWGQEVMAGGRKKGA